MKKVKFNVGDKVRLKKNLEVNKYYDGIAFISGMKRFDGSVGIVKNVESKYITVKFKNDSSEFTYTSAMLEPVNEAIVVYRDGRKVVALNKSTDKKAIARCHPDDIFDFEVGAKIAIDRLLNVENITINDDSIKVGDIVIVTDSGRNYSIYIEYVRDILKDFPVKERENLMMRYAYGDGWYKRNSRFSCNNDTQFRVIAIKNNYAYIERTGRDSAPCYLFGVDALEKVIYEYKPW